MSAEGAGRSHLPAAELINLSDDPTALFGPDGALLAVNRALRQQFAPVESFLAPGTPWPMLLSEIERRALLDPSVCLSLKLYEERLLDRADAQAPLQATLPSGDPAALELVPLSDGGFALVMHPAQEEAGGESEIEQLMRKVLEACPTSLVMARVGDGQILYRSPAATELLGKSSDSRSHFARREESADFLTMLLPDARVDDMRITGRRPDGSEFPASISARLIDYRGQEVAVSSMADLTADIALQRELARRKEQVFQAEKMSALGELLAGVAHELNNPLSIVIGNATILMEDELPADSLRRVEKLSFAAERCVRIVKTFLSMARERPLDLVEVTAGDLIETAIDAFRAGEPGAAMEIETEMEPDLPDIRADEVQLVQVLSNLLVNAKQAQGDGPDARVHITATLSSPDRVTLTLADFGPGIPEDIRGRIFDPLFTTKTAGKGTGVGLALCHRIMAAHGGTIALAPSERGAVFELTLPVADP